MKKESVSVWELHSVKSKGALVMKNLGKRKTARARLSARAAGGTVGIDQEVVTLRGLFGNSGSQHDLILGGSQP